MRAALDLVAAVSRARRRDREPGARARARGCSRARPRSRSAQQGRAWSRATSSTPPRGSSRVAEPGRSRRRVRRVARPRRRSSTKRPGSLELKGKAEPMPLWRALRVVAGVSGARSRTDSRRRSSVATASSGCEGALPCERRRAKGASRLGHRHGRDRQVPARVGVLQVLRRARRDRLVAPRAAAWPTAKASRTGRWPRWCGCAAGIAEDEDAVVGRAKLRADLERVSCSTRTSGGGSSRGSRSCSALEERARTRTGRTSSPRGGCSSSASPTTARSCSCSRTCSGPTCRLLDFIEYLLDWSRRPPLFVLALARPELADRAADLGRRSAQLHPSTSSRSRRRRWTSCSTAFVPGPAGRRSATQILERAEGVPLYAVETVRMLLDRGLLEPDGDGLPADRRRSSALEVPETLHALIAARLDGLSAEERRLVQDAAVLGKTFTKPALAAVTGWPDDRSSRSSTRSSARKSSRFRPIHARPSAASTASCRTSSAPVAYETLSRRERKATHLAAAAHLELQQDERRRVVEVVAAHSIGPRARPDADDAGRSRERGADISSSGRALGVARGQRGRPAPLRAALDLTRRARSVRRSYTSGLGSCGSGAAGRAQARTHLEEAVAGFEELGLAPPGGACLGTLGGLRHVGPRSSTSSGPHEDLERSFAALAGQQSRCRLRPARGSPGPRSLLQRPP